MRVERDVIEHDGLAVGHPVVMQPPAVQKVLARITVTQWPEGPQFGCPESTVTYQFTDGTFTNSRDWLRPAEEGEAIVMQSRAGHEHVQGML